MENSSQWAISESFGPLYQNEVEWSTFDMVTIFHSHVKKVIFTRKAVHLPSF